VPPRPSRTARVLPAPPVHVILPPCSAPRVPVGRLFPFPRVGLSSSRATVASGFGVASALDSRCTPEQCAARCPRRDPHPLRPPLKTASVCTRRSWSRMRRRYAVPARRPCRDPHPLCPPLHKPDSSAFLAYTQISSCVLWAVTTGGRRIPAASYWIW
jgi:hypothetical protein